MKNNNTRLKNEAFPHDVDHMTGTRGIGLSAQDSRDLLNKSNSSYGSKQKWDQDVARVNAEILDDQAEFTTDANGFVQVLINGVAFARWSRRNGNGDINIRVARTQSAKMGMNESKSILSEALNEISTAPDRVTNYNPWFAPNRAMASNKSGKYCLTRDNPPVRGKGFMCFGGEKDAIAAWKRLTNNVGVKIVRESAFREDGTPLKEGEVLLVDTSTLSEAVGDRYADQLAAQLRPGLVDEDDILNQAFEIAHSELGAKRARYMFAYDEDFASDLVSAYFANERAGGVQEAAGDKKSPVPRNFVAKYAKKGGAGQHKDEKRAAKQGDSKHKGKLDEQALVQADLAALKKRTK